MTTSETGQVWVEDTRASSVLDVSDCVRYGLVGTDRWRSLYFDSSFLWVLRSDVSKSSHLPTVPTRRTSETPRVTGLLVGYGSDQGSLRRTPRVRRICPCVSLRPEVGRRRRGRAPPGSSTSWSGRRRQRDPFTTTPDNR